MSTLIEIKEDRGILIVDDDESLLEALKEALELNGYRNVSVANCPEKGLSILEAKGESIYIVLLDLNMPSMNGIEFIQHLVNVHRNSVGIIMITGYGSPDVENEFYRIEDELVLTESFIEKPFRIDLIKDKIDEVSNNIYKKRMGYLYVPTIELHKKLRDIETNLGHFGKILNTKIDLSLRPIAARLENIERNIFQFERQFELVNVAKINELLLLAKKIDQKQPSFLASLGLDVIRIILIALAVLCLLYIDIGEILSSISLK